MVLESILQAIGIHLLDILYSADDAATGHHLVTFLELGQQLGMALSRLT